MAKLYSEIPAPLQEFISHQKVFFVGTAAKDGRINISPKGMDSLRVVNENKVIWLNVTGSGNETAAHLLKLPRMTIMFCSFDTDPMILRLYGTAKIFHPRDEEFTVYAKLLPDLPGARQIIEMDVDLVQTSCGYAVPFMEFKEERGQLRKWADKKDEEQMKDYWEQKNSKSIDGFETGIH